MHSIKAVITNMAHTFAWEIYEVRKGMWAFFLNCAFRILIGWGGKHVTLWDSEIYPLGMRLCVWLWSACAVCRMWDASLPCSCTCFRLYHTIGQSRDSRLFHTHTRDAVPDELRMCCSDCTSSTDRYPALKGRFSRIPNVFSTRSIVLNSSHLQVSNN